MRRDYRKDKLSVERQWRGAGKKRSKEKGTGRDSRIVAEKATKRGERIRQGGVYRPLKPKEVDRLVKRKKKEGREDKLQKGERGKGIWGGNTTIILGGGG